MTYSLILNKKVIKFIKKRTLKEQNNINTKLKTIKENPYPS